MFAMLRQFKMTVGRKIYALIGLSFLGVVGITVLDSGASWRRASISKSRSSCGI